MEGEGKEEKERGGRRGEAGTSIKHDSLCNIFTSSIPSQSNIILYTDNIREEGNSSRSALFRIYIWVLNCRLATRLCAVAYCCKDKTRVIAERQHIS